MRIAVRGGLVPEILLWTLKRRIKKEKNNFHPPSPTDHIGATVIPVPVRWRTGTKPANAKRPTHRQPPVRPRPVPELILADDATMAARAARCPSRPKNTPPASLLTWCRARSSFSGCFSVGKRPDTVPGPGRSPGPARPAFTAYRERYGRDVPTFGWGGDQGLPRAA